MSDSPDLWDRASLPDPVIPLDRSFEGWLGIEWLTLDHESAHVRFEVRENLKQPLGLLHGGVYSAVAETIASVATVYAVWNDGCTGSGMSNNASFLRPVTAGSVEAIAQRRWREEDRWVWHAEFRDERARLCALVEVTIAVRPAP